MIDTNSTQFWNKHLGTPEGVAHWRFYSYEYLDDLRFMPPARELLKKWPHAETLITAIEKKFKSLGWEGDGIIQILWLPPFAGAGPSGHGDTYGCYALHVKQDNDGISWLASPFALPFHRLFQPDDARYHTVGDDPYAQGKKSGATDDA